MKLVFNGYSYALQVLVLLCTLGQC